LVPIGIADDQPSVVAQLRIGKSAQAGRYEANPSFVQLLFSALDITDFNAGLPVP
jgi:hypothetical protein